jgi:hypothetical protein
VKILAIPIPPLEAWDFLAAIADQNIGDGSFHEEMLVAKWQGSRMFQVHGDTVKASA